jgi:hypothetical protein
MCYGRLTHLDTIQTSVINTGKLTLSFSKMGTYWFPLQGFKYFVGLWMFEWVYIY